MRFRDIFFLVLFLFALSGFGFSQEESKSSLFIHPAYLSSSGWKIVETRLVFVDKRDIYYSKVFQRSEVTPDISTFPTSIGVKANILNALGEYLYLDIGIMLGANKWALKYSGIPAESDKSSTFGALYNIDLLLHWEFLEEVLFFGGVYMGGDFMFVSNSIGGGDYRETRLGGIVGIETNLRMDDGFGFYFKVGYIMDMGFLTLSWKDSDSLNTLGMGFLVDFEIRYASSPSGYWFFGIEYKGLSINTHNSPFEDINTVPGENNPFDYSMLYYSIGFSTRL